VQRPSIGFLPGEWHELFGEDEGVKRTGNLGINVNDENVITTPLSVLNRKQRTANPQEGLPRVGISGGGGELQSGGRKGKHRKEGISALS